MLQPQGIVGLLVAQHERLVHSRERLVLRILQQTRGAYRQGVVRFRKKGPQILRDRRGERRVQESLLNLRIVGRMNREIEQVVLRKKAVKRIRRQHRGRRHAHAHLRKPPRDSSLVQHVPGASDSAQRLLRLEGKTKIKAHPGR